jgi:hypothetical protein
MAGAFQHTKGSRKKGKIIGISFKKTRDGFKK